VLRDWVAPIAAGIGGGSAVLGALALTMDLFGPAGAVKQEPAAPVAVWVVVSPAALHASGITREAVPIPLPAVLECPRFDVHAPAQTDTLAASRSL
jgi:hypothetical protein